jgi:hypothetical protein
MPVVLDEDAIHFDGHCAADDALALVEGLAALERPVRLDGCEGMHAALFQALIRLPVRLEGEPRDPVLAEMLKAARASSAQPDAITLDANEPGNSLTRAPQR